MSLKECYDWISGSLMLPSENMPFKRNEIEEEFQHIACSLSKANVVPLLLAHPQVDDSICNHQSRTCLEVCKSAHIAKLIQGWLPA